MEIRRVCILGGGGFIGRHLVCELTRHQYETRVITRRPQRHREVLVFPTCELIEGDVHDQAALAAQLRGCDAVVNLVGILNEHPKRGDRFERVHAELPAGVVAACAEAGVGRLLHMSALGAGEDGPSQYLKSKGRGEDAAHAGAEHGIAVTSFRPSVVFGPGDGFFNRFALLLALSPAVFPLACPNSRLQPVYVGDLVRAFAASLRDRRTAGKRYDLAGPTAYTLRELVEYTAQVTGRRRRIIGLSDGNSEMQAQILGRLPGKPFTMDNFLSLTRDSVTENNALPELGVEPTPVEQVVPTYLGRHNRTGFYDGLRSSAGRG